ncbi:MAG: sigma-70 family RNA polymerase sigma factor, partial [Chlorobiales bacterium]|nr:sigma-70 family RNA polymerase sigma factor [Chlorobiales bacterium]
MERNRHSIQEDEFSAIVAEHQDMVLNTCYRFVLNREDAEDIAQEVFLEAYRSLDSFRQESKLSTWIYRI